MSALGAIPTRAAHSFASSPDADAVPPPASLVSSAGLPSAVRLERRRGGGRVLVANRALGPGDIVLQEAPLAALPPFNADVTRSTVSKDGVQGSGWPAVESLCLALHYRDDALLLYRAVQLYYLLFLTAEARGTAAALDASRTVAQRILALFDPLRPDRDEQEDDEEEGVESVSTSSPMGSHAAAAEARRISAQAEFAAAVHSEAGRAALEELFLCVASQSAASMGVPLVRVSLQDADRAGVTLCDESHFLSHALPFARIYNVNNMSVSSSTGAHEGWTAVYDTLSRLNHSCLPRCVHFLEHDEEVEAQARKPGGNSFTPQSIAAAASTQMRTSSAAASTPTSSAVVSAAAAVPFLRTLRSLCSAAEGAELSISYLSPQMLCQSTARRQDFLQEHWKFVCECERCQGVDTVRVLRCPSCAEGSVLFHPVLTPSSSGGADPGLSEPSFTLVSSCPCPPLTGSASASLLKSEARVEDEWARFQAALPTCTKPVELCALFSSLLRREGVSESHWVAFEFSVVQRDLQALLQKRMEEMEQCKRVVWFLESRAFGREVPASVMQLPGRGSAYGQFSQGSLLIDVSSAHFLSPAARLARLCVTSELRDAWASFADLLWSIHTDKSADLARMLVQRSLYFTVCASLATGMLTPRDSKVRRDLQHKVELRTKLARAKWVDIDRIVEEDEEGGESRQERTAQQQQQPQQQHTQDASANSPATAAPSGLHAPPAGSLSCHSPVCSLNAFSAAPPVAALLCTRCKAVRYCSRECQKTDWPLHKKQCKPPNVA